VWLLYLLARRLGLTRSVALFAAFLLAIHPSHVAQSKWMSVNAPVTFLHLFAFLMLERWIRRGDGNSRVTAGLALGLAVSTKFSALLLLPLVPVAALLRALRGRDGGEPATVFGRWSWRALGGASRGALVILALAAATLAATSPYLFLASGEAADRLRGFASTVPAQGGLVGALKELPPAVMHTMNVLIAASTPLLLLLAGWGGLLLARGQRGFALLVLGWTILFGLMTLRMRHLATDSRFLPLAPILCLLAAVGLAALWEKHRLVGWVTAVVLCLTVAGWSVAVLQRFIGPAPQQLASDWALQHAQGHERVWIAGIGIYLSPDLVMREYFHEGNETNYERRTAWTLSPENRDSLNSHAAGKRFDPDLVFVSMWRPYTDSGAEWLADPDYQVAAAFPGKIRLFGHRVHPWLDVLDVDIWVLRRRVSGA
jgi:4-amino-4-deoxy-L-arabinose transferase-like glycosyltransferase